jgi:thiamine-phosphate pyrophosphorylase
MHARSILCYITDRSAFPGSDAERRVFLLKKIWEAARAGVDYIQLREKDLCGRALEELAREAVRVVREAGTRTALLINSRTDLALAVGADGVHLRSEDMSARDVREIWKKSFTGGTALPVIGVSCHSVAEVARAAADGASFAVFAPVFEKKDAPQVSPSGLERLREACHEKIPVLALGGVTVENARLCLEAGAAGIAGIRLFQEGDVAEVVRRLQG